MLQALNAIFIFGILAGVTATIGKLLIEWIKDYFSPFYIEKSEFTHYATFYGIPCYWNDATEVLAGRNEFYDRLIEPATVLHNLLIEPLAQLFARLSDRAYAPGFAIYTREFETPVVNDYEH